ncbi:MAG: hypothetical protein HYU66_03320 [Armatimonadetes bacterium]|nr:hypothetical protein [Armatimonadota bacterium]
MRLCLLLAAAAPALGAVKVDFALWAPDRGTPYSWFEGAREIQSYFSQDYRAAGQLQAYVRNTGAKPVSPSAWRLDGQDLDALRKAQTVIWWRILPDPLPPGALGEVTIRLRGPLTRLADLTLDFDDGSTASVTIRPEPGPLRIQTVGFNGARDRVFLVAERLTGAAQTIERVGLDGVDVTARARLLAPGFASGLSPVVLRPAAPLARGSYHVFTVTARSGARAGCAVRTVDDWVPLATYGYGLYEEYARNGCNGYINFGRSSQGELDSQATLLMRGVSTVRDNPLQDFELGHRGLYAYYLQDEPDCADYGVTELPAPVRIGQHAQEMEHRRRYCARTDPVIPTLLTIDMTYKPANYFIYGPIPDVCNVDCYPFCFGGDLKTVREVVETCRQGAGPRPLTFTFQSQYEEPDDPAARAKLRFARPPTAGEERLMIYEAVGAGARGLFNYIHCTERMGKQVSHGSGEYPDEWAEIGRCYRELGSVAPYLALAHPAKLATCSAPKVRVSTLVCGDDALLLVLANQDYRQEAQAFWVNPAAGVMVTLPPLPWLKPAGAWRITERGAVPLKLKGATVTVERVETAELLLVSSNPRAGEEAAAAAARRQEQVGAALLTEWRHRQRSAADLRIRIRRLAGECGEFAVSGQGIGAYGTKEGDYWNPALAAYPAFEWGVNEAVDGPRQGAEWPVVVTAEQTGQEQRVYLMLGNWGRPLSLTVTGADGQELVRRDVSEPMGGAVVTLLVTFPVAGTYTVRVTQEGTGPRGGRAAVVSYVVPAEVAP